MTAGTQTILQQALTLDAVERAELIEALFRSFDKAGDRRVDPRWAGEAEARVAAHDAGKIPAHPAAAVLRRIGKR